MASANVLLSSFDLRPPLPSQRLRPWLGRCAPQTPVVPGLLLPHLSTCFEVCRTVRSLSRRYEYLPVRVSVFVAFVRNDRGMHLRPPRISGTPTGSLFSSAKHTFLSTLTVATNRGPSLYVFPYGLRGPPPSPRVFLFLSVTRSSHHTVL